MTEKANPSINRAAEAFKTAGTIALGGGTDPGWVVESANPTEISTQDPDIDETNLNAFNENHSSSSFDVTIEGGEAFVFGSWLAKDNNTTVTLASSTANQTVYVGWNKDGSDDVIIGLASAFATASGDTDKKIPLWDFDTDGSGVTAATDRRQIGKITSGSVDLDGEQLTDSTQNYLDVTGDGNDLRLATGQAIEDGGGNNRVALYSNRTDVFDSDGVVGIRLEPGVSNRMDAFSDTPWQILDQQGGFTAVQYTTSSSVPGTLELTNAALDMARGMIDNVDNIEWTDNSDGTNYWGMFMKNDIGILSIRDRVNSTTFLQLHPNGPVEVHLTNLRLDTGQAIEDGGGQNRFSIASSDHTEVLTGGGEMMVQGKAGVYNRLWADPNLNKPLSIWDNEGGFYAVDYLTSASAPATLRLSNSNLNLNENTIKDVNYLELRDSGYPSGDKWQLLTSPGSTSTDGDESFQLGYRDSSAGTTNISIKFNRGGPIEILSQNLRLDTGQSIEDSSGNDRLEINTNFTQVARAGGIRGIDVTDTAVKLYANATKGVKIVDEDGNFDAVTYSTSSSAPGTLELRNASLDMAGHDINQVSKTIHAEQSGRPETASGLSSYGMKSDSTDVGDAGDIVVGSHPSGNTEKYAVLYDYSADAISSERFKKNIRKFERDEKSLLSVDAKTWESDDENETTVHGFIAEDVIEVMPEAVITKEAKKDDSWIDEEYLSRHGYEWGDEVPQQLRPIPILAGHHEIICEQQERIESLEKRIEQLEQAS